MRIRAEGSRIITTTYKVGPDQYLSGVRSISNQWCPMTSRLTNGDGPLACRMRDVIRETMERALRKIPIFLSLLYMTHTRSMRMT